MKILLVRGAFLNRYEGQNMEYLQKKHSVVGVGSATSIDTKLKFPVKKLFSLYDICNGLGRAHTIFGRASVAVFNRLAGDPHYIFGLENFVKQNAPWDIAHIAETYYGYDSQIVKLKRQGYIRKIVSTCWETIPFNNESVYKKRKIKESVKGGIDLYVCPTFRAKNALIKEGVAQSKIKVIRIGVDLSKFKPPKKKRGGSVNILFVGRLVSEKGVLDLIEAFKGVVRKMGDRHRIKLNIVGNGPLKNKILLYIKRNKMEEYIFTSKAAYEDMPKIYSNSHILVFPSKTTKTWEEQYGMVLVEGMASALAIIAYNSGAIGEVVGSSAVLIAEGDTKALSKTLIDLVERKNVRTRLSYLAHKRAKMYFDGQDCAQNINDLYFALYGK